MRLSLLAFVFFACSQSSKEPSSSSSSQSSETTEIKTPSDSSVENAAESQPLDTPSGQAPPPLGDKAQGVRMDLSVMKPQLSSDAIEDAVVISGSLTGDCSGDIRIDANENDLNIPEGKPLPGPLVAVSLSKTGPFSLRVPKGKSLSMVAFCDQDKNKKIENGIDLSSDPQNLGTLSEDKNDIEIKLMTISALPQQKLPPIDKMTLPSLEPQEPAE